MSLVYGGGNAVVWYAPKKDFPYVDGIVPIVISWFLSPIAAAIVCFVIFLAVRTLVLRRQNSTKLAMWVLPVLIIVTIWVNLFFILVSRGSGVLLYLLSASHTCCPCLCSAARAGLI